MSKELDEFKRRGISGVLDETHHTPGTWSHYRGKLRPQFPTLIQEIQDEDGNAIVTWNGFDGVDLPKRQITANARLMAASPDLLQACAYLISVFGPDVEYIDGASPHEVDSIANARAAIQRATGFKPPIFTGEGEK